MIELKGYLPFEYVVDSELSILIDEKAALLGLKRIELTNRLEDTFRPQLEYTIKQEGILDFLGITPPEWEWILNETQGDWKELQPSMVSDDEYWGPDIVRIGTELRAKGWLNPCSPYISRQLTNLVKAYAAPSPVSMVRLRPTVMPRSATDLPANYEDMQRKYGSYIYEQVRRASKIRTDQELRDVTQHVWMHLMEARILDRFRETAETALPSTLTFAEALAFMGLTKEQWEGAREEGQWLPPPISGSYEKGDALFMTTDIQTLDVSGFLKRERGERRHPTVTGRGFKSYLCTAINNHFKNLLRTRERRHKERPIDSSRNSLSMNSTGSCNRIRADEGGGSAWEENITDEWTTILPIEDMVDLAQQLNEYGLDPTRSEDLDILDTFTRGNTTLKGSMRKHKKSLRPVQAA